MNPCTSVGGPRVVAHIGGMVLEPESSRATVVVKMIDIWPGANGSADESGHLKKIPKEVALPMRKLHRTHSVALLMARDNDLPNPAMNGSCNSSHRRSDVVMPHDRRVPKPRRVVQPRPQLTRAKSTRSLMPTDNDLPSPATNRSRHPSLRDADSTAPPDRRVRTRRASLGPDKRVTLVEDNQTRPRGRRRSTSLSGSGRMGDNSFTMDYDSRARRPRRTTNPRNSTNSMSTARSVHNLSLLSDNDLSLRARKKAVKPQSAHRVSMLPDDKVRSGIFLGAAPPKRESPPRSSLLKRAGFFLSKQKRTDTSITDGASTTQST